MNRKRVERDTDNKDGGKERQRKTLKERLTKREKQREMYKDY